MSDQSGPWGAPTTRKHRSGGAWLLFGLISAILIWQAMSAPHETPQAQQARCNETAALGGHLYAIDPDQLPSWLTRAQFDALPDGDSVLPNGEAVTVSRGCAFVSADRPQYRRWRGELSPGN